MWLLALVSLAVGSGPKGGVDAGVDGLNPTARLWLQQMLAADAGVMLLGEDLIDLDGDGRLERVVSLERGDERLFLMDRVHAWTSLLVISIPNSYLHVSPGPTWAFEWPGSGSGASGFELDFSGRVPRPVRDWSWFRDHNFDIVHVACDWAKKRCTTTKDGWTPEPDDTAWSLRHPQGWWKRSGLNDFLSFCRLEVREGTARCRPLARPSRGTSSNLCR